MIRLVVLALVLAAAAPARAQSGECGDFPLPPCTCGDFPLPPCTVPCGTFPLPPCGVCGEAPLPECCSDGLAPPCCGRINLPLCWNPICGVPGTPPCIPTCGTADTPLCPTCGTPTTPPCPEPTCGVEGLPPCETCDDPPCPWCGGPNQPICEVPPTCGIEGTPPCPTCGVPGTPDCPCGIEGGPNCLSPPVVRCGEGDLPACVDPCLETLAVPICVASGTHLCLAHRWTFDEASGAVGDSVGTVHGTLTEQATRTDGLQGNALFVPPRQPGSVRLDAALAPFGTSDFTVAAWLRMAVDAADSTVFTLGGATLKLTGGRLTVLLGGFSHTTALPLSHSRWNHVALVRSGVRHLLFVNGYATDVVPSGAVLDLATANAQTFGPTTGVLEDVRIYQGALAPEQVRILAAGLCALSTD